MELIKSKKSKLFTWPENLKPKFPKFIENLFGRKISDEAGKGKHVSSIPAVNVEMQDKKFDIEVALPGVKKENIKIDVRNGTLNISSEKQYTSEEAGRNFIRQEFAYAAFCRSFALPPEVDAEKISASFNDGILKISIPSKNNKKRHVKPIKVM